MFAPGSTEECRCQEMEQPATGKLILKRKNVHTVQHLNVEHMHVQKNISF